MPCLHVLDLVEEREVLIESLLRQPRASDAQRILCLQATEAQILHLLVPMDPVQKTIHTPFNMCIKICNACTWTPNNPHVLACVSELAVPALVLSK